MPNDNNQTCGCKTCCPKSKGTKPKNDGEIGSTTPKAARKPKASRGGVFPFAKAFDLVLPKDMKMSYFTRKKSDETVE
jgi:hypothetical protein